ncbi:hypothetical protein I4U23_000030 [Adineta vaga]|nr:hypothetical protein I4U23_000030 [Adineta vaga]
MSANNDTEAIAGYGVKGDRINASFESVWKAMLDSIYHPEKYIPVKNVKIIDNDDHIYREMLHEDGFLHKEKIFCDREKGEFTFIDPGDFVHKNKYYKDEQVLEYWLENYQGERISWKEPKVLILSAIKKTQELAEEQEE